MVRGLGRDGHCLLYQGHYRQFANLIFILKYILMTQMWVPCGFLLVQGTQNLIPGSLVPRNSLFGHLIRYVMEWIYRVA